MSINLTKLTYRKGVGLMILNSECKVFVGKRKDNKNEAWQMPQGGIDEGEELKVAVFREMQEEIGTDKAELIAETKDFYSYDLPEHLIPKLWDGKYKGQSQKWFLLKFLGNDEDIDIEFHDTPEFLEWKWSKMEDLPNIIVPFKRSLYISVIEEFRDEIIKLKQNVR